MNNKEGNLEIKKRQQELDDKKLVLVRKKKTLEARKEKAYYRNFIEKNINDIFMEKWGNSKDLSVFMSEYEEKCIEEKRFILGLEEDLEREQLELDKEYENIY